MDAFATLERKVEELIGAYRGAQARVAELESENRALRDAAGGGDEELERRIGALESERAELRARLEKLLAALDAIEL